MPAKVRAFAIALAVIALACLIAAIWSEEHMWKLLGTGGVLLGSAIIAAAIASAPVKK